MQVNAVLVPSPRARLHSIALQWKHTAKPFDIIDMSYVVVAESVPVPVQGNHAFSLISSGYNFTCGIDKGGSLWCWEVKSTNGQGSQMFEPVEIGKGRTFVAVSAAWDYACALDTSGDVLCFGKPRFGWQMQFAAHVRAGHYSTHEHASAHAVVLQTPIGTVGWALAHQTAHRSCPQAWLTGMFRRILARAAGIACARLPPRALEQVWAGCAHRLGRCAKYSAAAI